MRVTKVRIKSGFDILTVDGQYILSSDNGKKTMDTIYLDEISLFLWNELKQKDFLQTEMLNLLLDNFEISTVLALSEVDKFVKILTKNGIIE